MENQTSIDFTERYTLPQCEFLYDRFKTLSDKTCIVKDEKGFFVSLFYSKEFLENRLKCIVIKK